MGRQGRNQDVFEANDRIKPELTNHVRRQNNSASIGNQFVAIMLMSIINYIFLMERNLCVHFADILHREADVNPRVTRAHITRFPGFLTVMGFPFKI